ncbi:MAG: hypothetical protein ABI537_08445 [Casimicrobiaceae bacterium]
MTETSLPEASISAASAAPGTPSSSLISMILLVYALFGAAAVASFVSSGLVVAWPLVGLVGIAGLIVAYIKRDEAARTWLESHLRWLIRTFWFSVLWDMIGLVLFVTLIGIPFAIGIWIATGIWVLYRLIRGYMLFKDSKPVMGM